MKLKTVFFGTPDFAVPSLRALAEETQVLAAVVRPDRPRGRGRKLLPPPVKQAAEDLAIPVLQPEKMKETWFLEKLGDLGPELIVTAAFGRIVPREILELPRLGCWNVHGSILPGYRGAAPIQRALWNGETETGITLMRMDEGLDTGPVLLVKPCAIRDDDDAGTLTERLALLGAEVVKEGLRRLGEGRLVAAPQPAEGTLAPMIGSEESSIDWAAPAAAIRNQVRALAPRPGAHTATPLGPVKILAVEAVPAENLPGSGDPGTVVRVTKNALVLAAGGGTGIAVSLIQPAGKAPMTVGAFLQGRSVPVGQRWGEAAP